MSMLFQIVVCAILINKNKKIFIARRAPQKKLASKWEFPGGKLEIGEEVEPALAREIREELAIKIKSLKLLHIKPYSYEHGNVLILFYTCEDFLGDPQIQDNDHDKFSWCTVEELKKLDLLPANQEVLEKLAHFLQNL